MRAETATSSGSSGSVGVAPGRSGARTRQVDRAGRQNIPAIGPAVPRVIPRMERPLALRAVAVLLAGTASFRAAAVEDISYVTEHLAEVPMDNRFATLPVWSGNAESGRARSFAGQLGFSKTTTGNLEVAGPLFSASADRALSSRWRLGAFGFYDRLSFSGENDVRPLQTPFAPATPFARPVPAEFDNLDGSLTHFGAGLDAAIES